MRMIRAQIFMPAEMMGWLQKEAAKRGIPVSELLRRIIDKERGKL